MRRECPPPQPSRGPVGVITAYVTHVMYVERSPGQKKTDFGTFYNIALHYFNTPATLQCEIGEADLLFDLVSAKCLGRPNAL